MGKLRKGYCAMKIYEKIFARLEELHMSQTELSRRTGICLLYTSLYDILGTGMLSESEENPVCPVPPFPFAGLLLRDNGKDVYKRQHLSYP